MIYELLTTTEDGIKIFARIDEDGLCRVTCTEDDPGYVAWAIEEGIMEAPEVVEPEVVEPELAAEPDFAP